MDLLGAFVPLFIMIGVLMLLLIVVRSRGRTRPERLTSETPPPVAKMPPEETPAPAEPDAAGASPPGAPPTAPDGTIAGLPVQIHPEELPLAPDDPRLKILAQHLSREELARAGFPVPPEDLFGPDNGRP